MKLPPPGPVYALADFDALGETDLPAAAAEMAEAGVRWIQLRAKDISGARAYRLLERVSRRLEGADCMLWLDDRSDLAALFASTHTASMGVGLPVRGVHVGQRDLPPCALAAVGRVASSSTSSGTGSKAGVQAPWAIGASTHTPEQFDAALTDPHVDAIAVGPVFATTSKRDVDPEVGLDLVRTARRRLDEATQGGGRARPLIAIGGIDATNLTAVLDAGADTVAVLSAVCGPADTAFHAGAVATRCRRLLAAASAATAT